MDDPSGLSPRTATSILLGLIDDHQAFNPGGVAKHACPTAVEFAVQVGRGRPCVYRVAGTSTDGHHAADKSSRETDHLDSLLDCPALRWTRQSLCDKVTDDVEVAVTPDGRADSLYPLPDPDGGEGEEEDVFVQPATVTMSMSALLDKVTPPRSEEGQPSGGPGPAPVGPGPPVYYLQSQNSNLTTTSSLSPLRADLPATLPFASAVLGPPDATNLWIGGPQSVTSTHRDPYENLYLVLKGTKTFTLWPPCEEICLHAKRVRTAHHELCGDGTDPETASFQIVLDHPSSSSSSSSTDTDPDAGVGADVDHRIPWIPIDPLHLPPPATLADLYPYYSHSHPLTVTVCAGEVLYLPAGWFHHVTQECGAWPDGQPAPCIAVNYWYDMDYEGEKFAMREMLGQLIEVARKETGQAPS